MLECVDVVGALLLLEGHEMQLSILWRWILACFSIHVGNRMREWHMPWLVLRTSFQPSKSSLKVGFLRWLAERRGVRQMQAKMGQGHISLIELHQQSIT
jgi:hypothetical protein